MRDSFERKFKNKDRGNPSVFFIHGSCESRVFEFVAKIASLGGSYD